MTVLTLNTLSNDSEAREEAKKEFSLIAMCMQCDSNHNEISLDAPTSLSGEDLLNYLINEGWRYSSITGWVCPDCLDDI